MPETLMSREQALQLLRDKLHTEHLIHHSLASEAIMRSLARRLGGDEELWGLSGLLHDLDLEEVGDDMSRHGEVTAEWLAERGFPEAGIDAIRHHNAEGLGLTRTTQLHFAITAAEQITGLIRATALIYPSRKLADIKNKSVRKRMKDKRFAAAVNRDRIRLCSELGIELADFIELSVAAMKDISDDLGL